MTELNQDHREADNYFNEHAKEALSSLDSLRAPMPCVSPPGAAASTMPLMNGPKDGRSMRDEGHASSRIDAAPAKRPRASLAEEQAQQQAEDLRRRPEKGRRAPMPLLRN